MRNEVGNIVKKAVFPSLEKEPVQVMGPIMAMKAVEYLAWQKRFETGIRSSH